MNATTLYHRKLFSGSRELNYGNTVLVQRDNGQWWLGYVQDLDGPYLYIDFDANSISAQWIHSSHLWPHRFRYPLSPPTDAGSSIQVALRRTPADPRVFWPGTIVDQKAWPFYVVRLQGDSSDGMNPQFMVHRNHCVKRLPMPYDGENFFERTTGFVYRKHVISFPRAQMLLDVDFIPTFLARTCRLIVDSTDVYYVGHVDCRFVRNMSVDQMHFVCNSPGHPHGVYFVDIGCRVFVRVESDTIIFICAEVLPSAHSSGIFWDEDSLKKSCDDYLTENLKVKPLTDATPWSALQLDFEEMSIVELPHSILASVLRYLDVDSQLRTSRVCALWGSLIHLYINRDVLCDLCTTTCERIPHDLSETRAEYVDPGVDFEYGQYLAYKLVMTLDHVISTRTHTLALTEDGKHFQDGFDLATRMGMIRTTLVRKDVRLPIIMVKNARDGITDEFLTIGRDALNRTWECHSLSEFMEVCEQFMLVNFTATLLFSKAARLILNSVPGLPDSERALIRRCLVEVQLTIPCLCFRSVDAPAEQTRILLAAANDHCPVVSPSVHEKVTAMHARWVRTLNYPEQWTGIRVFLQLFNSFHLDDTSQRWNQMDLRKLDIAVLTRITFAALDGCFED